MVAAGAAGAYLAAIRRDQPQVNTVDPLACRKSPVFDVRRQVVVVWVGVFNFDAIS